MKVLTNNIAKPLNTREVRYQDGDTQDIINVIIEADKVCAKDTTRFAPQLKGSTEAQTAANIWNFVKKNIRYQLDPLGVQWVKTPARTWADGYSDCKSRSIFQASLAKNLGLKGFYRFASYKEKDMYTHVYAVYMLNGKLIPSDPDMPGFGIEKPYKYKLDIPMSRIEYVAGIGTSKKEGRLHIYKPIGQMTDFDMQLAIRKQRAEVERQMIEKLSGIGCPHAERYNDNIDVIKSMIEIQSDKKLNDAQRLAGIGIISEMVENGEFRNYSTVAGIGNLGKRFQQREAMRRARMKRAYEKINAGHVAQVGKLKILKKVAEAAKKVTKAVTKVATAPMRIAAKGILEVALPKMAPMFLYLFITDPKLIEKLPAKARAKRKKSEKLAKFIVEGIGMKQDHFMGIIRNGIMKRYGRSPEDVINQQMKGKISGIGFAPIIMAIIPVIQKVVQTIVKLTKKKADPDVANFSANDAPDPSDFDSLAPVSDMNTGKNKKVKKEKKKKNKKGTSASDSSASATAANKLNDALDTAAASTTTEDTTQMTSEEKSDFGDAVRNQPTAQDTPGDSVNMKKSQLC